MLVIGNGCYGFTVYLQKQELAKQLQVITNHSYSDGKIITYTCHVMSFWFINRRYSIEMYDYI